MKKMFSYVMSVVLILSLCLSLAACGKAEEPADLWQDALYIEDTELGEGAKTLTVKVEAEDKVVNFTIHTDEKTVGAALQEHNLIEGENSTYGMYVKVVNGITADYDVNKAYWSFNKSGEYMMTGVDVTEFADGDSYELVYTK